ncbi:hypothetical protein TRFO_16734 [Tritrichomonas foetus]|uniref:Protein kinase domain-containing protein n=1 Tax=Tritrichomonas foetus TaxID=1144522 RepID=A0A1J4KU43_9EUKA|nr:hypothetical protein TRFO_16734 [Tritrichomonas foetus]|eukprot:OHT13182.1 hypothetical protein TRFO_16734 [Tritrichomonas foetus]
MDETISSMIIHTLNGQPMDLFGFPDENQQMKILILKKVNKTSRKKTLNTFLMNYDTNISYRNLAQVYNISDENNMLSYYMDFFHHGSLDSLIYHCSDRIDTKITYVLMYCLSMVLRYLHSINKIHGNIKLSNIMLEIIPSKQYESGIFPVLSDCCYSDTTRRQSLYDIPGTKDSGKEKKDDIFSFGLVMAQVILKKVFPMSDVNDIPSVQNHIINSLNSFHSDDPIILSMKKITLSCCSTDHHDNISIDSIVDGLSDLSIHTETTDSINNYFSSNIIPTTISTWEANLFSTISKYYFVTYLMRISDNNILNDKQMQNKIGCIIESVQKEHFKPLTDLIYTIFVRDFDKPYIKHLKQFNDISHYLVSVSSNSKNIANFENPLYQIRYVVCGPTNSGKTSVIQEWLGIDQGTKVKNFSKDDSYQKKVIMQENLVNILIRDLDIENSIVFHTSKKILISAAIIFLIFDAHEFFPQENLKSEIGIQDIDSEHVENNIAEFKELIKLLDSICPSECTFVVAINNCDEVSELLRSYINNKLSLVLKKKRSRNNDINIYFISGKQSSGIFSVEKMFLEETKKLFQLIYPNTPHTGVFALHELPGISNINDNSKPNEPECVCETCTLL